MRVLCAAISCALVFGAVALAQESQPDAESSKNRLEMAIKDASPEDERAYETIAAWLNGHRPAFPIHNIWGTGGLGLTQTAYFDPPAADGWLSMPGVSGAWLIGRHKDAMVFGISENLFDRVELSYGVQRWDLGNFDNAALPLDVSHSNVYVHNFSARVRVLNEGWPEFIGDAGGSGVPPWLPAVTCGVTYRKNTRHHDLNRDLGGALETAGIEDDDGFEVSMVATKTIKGVLPRPCFVSVGLRNTDAAMGGVYGFTNDRRWLWEANAGVMVRDDLAIIAEWLQMGSRHCSYNGLLGQETDWWGAGVWYSPWPWCNVTAGLYHLGTVFNEEEPLALLLEFKVEIPPLGEEED